MQEQEVGTFIKSTTYKVSLWLCHGLLVLVLFTLPTTFLLSFVFLRPDVVKDVLAQTTSYESFSTLIAESSAQAIDTTTQTYGLSEKVVYGIAKKVFSAENLQKKSEKLIDMTYSWLDGDRPTLDLNIDFTPEQKVFAGSIAEGLSAQIAAKPVCTQAQLEEFQIEQNQAMILNAPCRPQGVDAAFIESILEPGNQQAVAVEGVQNPNTSTALLGSIPRINNHFNGISIPVIFDILRASFYVLVVLLVVAIYGHYVLLKEKTELVWGLMKPFGTTGILLVIYALVSQWLFEQNVLSQLTGSAQQTDVVQQATHPFVMISIRTTLVFACIYIVTTVVLTVLLLRLRKHRAATRSSDYQV